MHPEQAPGPDDAPKPPTGATPNAARPDSSAGEQRENTARDEQTTNAPRDPEENPHLHTGTNITPVDHSMIESLGGLAPTDTHPVPEAAPADARDGNAPAPAPAPKPAKRRRRRSLAEYDRRIIPPFPLSPLAEKLWNRLFMSTPHLWLIASYFKAARYCTLFAMWIEISQVLNTKGMIYVRHAKDNARVDAIRIMPHFQYLMRLEYALESLERELGIDARKDAAIHAELVARVREDSDDEA